ncbi:EcoKI restriction-modification system protein HsdS [Psychrobacter pasteurii]|uniref:EcoKI restriction-modification system protein HsdS n=1 Tax=Psychrobacter pasteurii TaxID=1945520 RepID=A0A1R4EES7_9GAMM|nr:restriction endonuclease subunit S [Psychrobacter pasteurii]SJM36992.1 EcoKI restriction-modification system protein HsdS [Psychrobacter pasteurii]
MVPNGWSKLSLQDLVSINYGKSPKEIIDENGIYDIVGTGGITGSTNSYLHSGPSVIIGRKGTIDKPQFLEKPFWAIDTTFYCLPLDSKKLDMNWFYQLSQVIDWRKYNEASGVPSLSRGTIYSIKVPTPPIQEQQKIVKILTIWDKAIDTTERLIDNSKQHKKALMQQLLTGKKRLLDDEGKRFEGEWEEVILEDHLESFQNGYAFKASHYEETGIPIITMGNIGLDGKFNERLSKVNYWSYDKALERYEVNNGDLLIAMTDVTPDKNLIGRMTIVTTDKTFYLNQRVGLIKPKPTLDKHFLRCLSNDVCWRRYSLAVSASGVQANMSTKDIKNGTIKLPSFKEQQKIAAVLTNANKEIELLEQQLADLQQEKKALMQVLLTGKKRVRIDG